MPTNQQWLIAARPEGLVKESDFQWRESPVPSPGEGEVLVRSVYLSLDPTNRVWMNQAESYLPALAIGDVMRGGAIGKEPVGLRMHLPTSSVFSQS